MVPGRDTSPETSFLVEIQVQATRSIDSSEAIEGPIETLTLWETVEINENDQKSMKIIEIRYFHGVVGLIQYVQWDFQ